MVLESIVLGGGCFWCLEAVYQRVKGITSITSGYAGGSIQNPSYDQVSTGTTGHAEVVRLEFDPKLINLETILDIFWTIHNPTTRNQQGADIGTQYRSIVLYADDKQKAVIEKSLKNAQESYADKIVTEVAPLTAFYPAEASHQNYYNADPEQAYCQIVIDPKINKLRASFANLLK